MPDKEPEKYESTICCVVVVLASNKSFQDLKLVSVIVLYSASTSKLGPFKRFGAGGWGTLFILILSIIESQYCSIIQHVSFNCISSSNGSNNLTTKSSSLIHSF